MSYHGHVHATARTSDWGSRSKHPLYGVWTWAGRSFEKRDPRWDDFWVFVADVGERPSPDHKLKRYRVAEAFGPDNFYWEQTRASQTNGLQAKAKAAYMRQWNAENPLASKNRDLQRHYGIGIATFDAMLAQQGDRCAICKKPRDENFALAVDHCHATNAVRGLLCTNCNRGLGHFADDPELLTAAAAYLRAPPGAPAVKEHVRRRKGFVARKPEGQPDRKRGPKPTGVIRIDPNLK